MCVSHNGGNRPSWADSTLGVDSFGFRKGRKASYFHLLHQVQWISCVSFEGNLGDSSLMLSFPYQNVIKPQTVLEKR